MKKYTIITAAAIAALCSSSAYAAVSCNISNTSANVEVRNGLLYAAGTADFVGRNSVYVNRTRDTSSGRYVATLCSLAKNAIPNASTAQKNATNCSLTLKVNNTVRTGNCSDLSGFNPTASGGGSSSGGGSGSSACSIAATVHPTSYTDHKTLTYITQATVSKGSTTTTHNGRWLETICRAEGSNCSVTLNTARGAVVGGTGQSATTGSCANTNAFLPRAGAPSRPISDGGSPAPAPTPRPPVPAPTPLPPVVQPTPPACDPLPKVSTLISSGTVCVARPPNPAAPILQGQPTPGDYTDTYRDMVEWGPKSATCNRREITYSTKKRACMIPATRPCSRADFVERMHYNNRVCKAAYASQPNFKTVHYLVTTTKRPGVVCSGGYYPNPSSFYRNTHRGCMR